MESFLCSLSSRGQRYHTDPILDKRWLWVFQHLQKILNFLIKENNGIEQSIPVFMRSMQFCSSNIGSEFLMESESVSDWTDILQMHNILSWCILHGYWKLGFYSKFFFQYFLKPFLFLFLVRNVKKHGKMIAYFQIRNSPLSLRVAAKYKVRSPFFLGDAKYLNFYHILKSGLVFTKLIS